MKIKELQELSGGDLLGHEAALRKELFNLRIQKQVGSLENPLRIRAVRREVARILTVAQQKSATK